jgi:hypothetical protein
MFVFSALYQLLSQSGCAPIVLLSPPRHPSDLGRMAHPNLTAQLFEHLLEPGRTPTALKAHNHLALAPQPSIEATHIILLVAQFYLLYFSVFSCQITYGLFASMKVHSAVYCRHGVSFC